MGVEGDGDEAPSSTRANILLVDDQPARLLAYEAVLSGLAVSCVRALSGPEALQHLLNQEFAVILLDVQMPEIDGFELAKMIREHPRLERTPVIFVAGVHMSEFDRLRAYEVGAIDYISVPVVPDILRSKVAVLVELFLKRQELQALNRELQEMRLRVEDEHRRILADKESELENERLRNAALVRAGDRYNQALIQDAPVAIGHCALDGRFEGVNKAFCGLLGYTAEELHRLRWQDITHPDDIGIDSGLARQVLDGLLPHYTIQKRFVRKDGSVVWVNLFGNFLRDDANRPVQAVAIAIDITEQRNSTRALRESQERLMLAKTDARLGISAQDALKAADRRKDEFLAVLAHELRNPLAALSSAAHLLSKATQKPEVIALARDALHRQVHHISRLLDDLLDVARITHGLVQLQVETVNVGEAVRSALESVQTQIDSKQHHVHLQLSEETAFVDADPVRLNQVIANLLINSTKYTPPGGQITLRVIKERDDVAISVVDNGIGIAPGMLPHIFDMFSQVHRSEGAGGGLGIGLALVRGLVELHGGSIEARSAGEGQGSEFCVRLPLSKSQPAAHERPREGSDEPLGRHLRILVADDNVDSAMGWTILLEQQGHVVRTAYDGQAALAAAEALEPDLALLDIGMPHLNGYQVAERIRATAWGKQAVLVAITGWGQLRDRERASAAGFDHHLTKPATIDDIELILDSVRLRLT